MSKRIDVTCGYRVELDNGEIHYYPDATDNDGICYKDMDALFSGDGIAYIREACFGSREFIYGYKSKEGAITLDCDDDLFTRGEMYQWAKDYYFNDVSEEDYNLPRFLAHVVECIVDSLDWQGFDILLEEWDWDEDLEKYAYNRYSVLVGGGEVNDLFLSRNKAEEIADEWRAKGYDDVVVRAGW